MSPVFRRACFALKFFRECFKLPPVNRLYSILLPALLAGLFFLSACGRKETPKPKHEPPAPSMPKVLRGADVMFKNGVVCIKVTGAPFAYRQYRFTLGVQFGG